MLEGAFTSLLQSRDRLVSGVAEVIGQLSFGFFVGEENAAVQTDRCLGRTRLRLAWRILLLLGGRGGKGFMTQAVGMQFAESLERIEVEPKAHRCLQLCHNAGVGKGGFAAQTEGTGQVIEPGVEGVECICLVSLHTGLQGRRERLCAGRVCCLENRLADSGWQQQRLQ